MEGVLDLARRERGAGALVVMNRAPQPHTRLGAEVAQGAADLGATVADTQIGNRVAYAETLGQGLAVCRAQRRPAPRVRGFDSLPTKSSAASG